MIGLLQILRLSSRFNNKYMKPLIQHKSMKNLFNNITKNVNIRIFKYIAIIYILK